jgi:hypothetical protein
MPQGRFLTWGFDAVNLSGGMTAWAVAGLPVVTTGPGGADLVVHRIYPLNCETPIPALIGGVVMLNARFYVRNHFETPACTRRPGGWRSTDSLTTRSGSACVIFTTCAETGGNP